MLLPTTTYRATAFVEAARQIGVELTVASEQRSTLEAENPAGLLTLDFKNPERAADHVHAFARTYPIHGVVGVDDDTAIVAAWIAERLKLKGNSTHAAEAARDKHRQRLALADAGVPIPRFELHLVAEDPTAIAASTRYPCVLKPLRLSGSRGVIRANNTGEFIAAFQRLKRFLLAEGYKEQETHFLVEDFIPGFEVALEGILTHGQLKV